MTNEPKNGTIQSLRNEQIRKAEQAKRMAKFFTAVMQGTATNEKATPTRRA